jgi:ADP-ribose pyrophosphatase YjhB (NUDIX family)
VGHYCVDCGAALDVRRVEGRDLEACSRCSFVLWPDPKVATAVVVETDGGVVLGRRGIEPGYGLWCLPGGFVNDDEHPAEAAARECREEICADVDIESLLAVLHVRRRSEGGMIALAYRGRLTAGQAPTAGDEMLEVAVFAPDQVPELAFSSHRQALTEWRRIREFG